MTEGITLCVNHKAPEWCGGQAVLCRTCVQTLELQVEDLKAALDRDKTGLAAALAKIIEEVKGRIWVKDGRGNYAFNDDRYRQETGWALDAIEKLAKDALAASGKLAHEVLTSQKQIVERTK